MPRIAQSLALAALLSLGLLLPAAAEPVTPETFARALRAAGPGDTLELAAGDYGTLALSRRYEEAPLTIRSADPARPARFAALKMNGAAGVVIEGLVFDYRFAPGDSGRLRVSEITKSRDITVRGSLFDGDVAQGVSAKVDGYATAFGLSLRWTQDVRIEDNEFRTWFRGLVIGQSDDITLRGNEIHAIRSDGANFADVQGVLIEGNHFHDFRVAPESGDHRDMIQFWTNRTTRPSTDIVIRDNVFNSGQGLFTQSIFMRNEEVDTKRAGREMFYRNIAITGNVIINAHLHGITVGEAEGLRIEGNTLVRNPGSAGDGGKVALWTPKIRVKPASDRVAILRNITPGIDGAENRPDWDVSGNLIIQDRDPRKPGYYDTVFTAARQGNPSDLASFAYLPGGPADGTGVGAPALQIDRLATGGALALIRSTRDDRFVNRFYFNAGLSRLPDGAEPVWRFEGGGEARGTTVTYTFPAPGRYRVELTAGPARTSAEVTVPDPLILEFVPAQGGLVSGGKPVAAAAMRQDGDRIVIPIGGDIEPIKIPHGQIAGFFGAHDFTLYFRLKTSGVGNPSGEILRVHQALILSITPTGQLDLWLRPQGRNKPVTLRTSPGRLNDGRWHEVELHYLDGEIRASVNGTLRLKGRAAGPMPADGRWGLTLGGGFGKASLEAVLADLRLVAGATSFAR